MLKRTPLFAAHEKLGARLVEFGGWEMPILYGGIVEEHLAVRESAGLFDISHMGELTVRGPGATGFLNYALTNDLSRLAAGQGQYTLMCNEAGGVVDDLYVFRVKPQEYLLVVNAARIAVDWDCLQERVEHCPAKDGFALTNDSTDLGAVAVQGPRVIEFLGEVIPGGSIAGTLVASAVDLKKNQWAGFVYEGTPIGVARTGYTGEDGFELVGPGETMPPLWDALLRAGTECGLKPAGLGARDTLRLEMGYPLYGHELDETITPLEAGLSYFVALDKGEFVGREVLVAQRSKGVNRRCVALRVNGKVAPPRPGYAVYGSGENGRRIGTVTSGTQSPSLGVGIALAYVAADSARSNTEVAIEVRGRRLPAQVVKKPFYRAPAMAS